MAFVSSTELRPKKEIKVFCMILMTEQESYFRKASGMLISLMMIQEIFYFHAIRPEGG